MNDHLTDEQLIGYVHHTLTDAHREGIDRYLETCPQCRARLDEHESLQRQVHYGLRAAMKTASPSNDMAFTALVPRLKRVESFAKLRRMSGQLMSGAATLAAATGLVMALAGLLESGRQLAASPTLVSNNSLPIIACVLFVIPTIGNYYQSRIVYPRLIIAGILAFILWIGTAILGLQVIVIARDLLIWLVFRGLGNFSLALALGSLVLLPLGAAWIVLVIGGGEYHYKRVGQPSSWTLFGLVITIELLMLILPYQL
jgi:hypothetical protein